MYVLTYGSDSKVLTVSSDDNKIGNVEFLIRLGMFISDRELKYANIYQNKVNILDFDLEEHLIDFLNFLDISEYKMERISK